jgi:hypothetical protein
VKLCEVQDEPLSIITEKRRKEKQAVKVQNPKEKKKEKREGSK